MGSCGSVPSAGPTTPSRRRSSKIFPTLNPARRIPPTYRWPRSRDYRSCNAHHPSRTHHQRLHAAPPNRRRSRCAVKPPRAAQRGVQRAQHGDAGSTDSRPGLSPGDLHADALRTDLIPALRVIGQCAAVERQRFRRELHTAPSGHGAIGAPSDARSACGLGVPAGDHADALRAVQGTVAIRGTA